MKSPRQTPASPSVDDTVGAVRRHLRTRGGWTGLLGALAVAAALFLAAWLLAGEGWRAGSPVPLLLWVVSLAALGTGGWLLAGRLLRWTREEALADEAERAAGLPSGRLRAQLELDREVPRGGSGTLARAGSSAILSRLDGGADSLSGRPGRELSRLLFWSALGGGGLALAVLALLVLAPDRSRTAWAGLSQPVAVWTGGLLPALALEPGDAVLPRGSIPEVVVRAGERARVTLHWQAVGEPLREEVLDVEGGVARGALPRLDAPVRYWASAPDGARTREARITPSDPFVFGELSLELRFPEYTRLPVEVIRGAPSELAVPEGTRIVISGTLDAPGTRGLVLRRPDGEEELRIPIEVGRFEGGWRPERSLVLAWELDEGPPDASLPGLLELVVVPDAPPQIELPVPGDDGVLPPSLRLPLLARASDDHGLAWIAIEAVRERLGGEREDPVVERIPAGGHTTLDLSPVLDVSGWGLRPGESILLSAVAADNSPRGQRARTREFRLEVPSAAVLRDAGRDGIERAAERLDALVERAREEARELRDLEREARLADDRGRGRGADFEEREELRTAAGQSDRTTSELDELRAELEQARRSLEGTGGEDGGLRERLRELESLLSRLTDPEERERLDELMERLAAGDRTDAAEELEEMARAREELSERLAEALERFRREALEEAFAGAEEEVRGIAEAQERLIDRLDTAEGQAAQDSLAARTDQARDRVDELADRLAVQGDEGAAERAREAAQGLDEARQAMERAASESRSGDRDAGAEEARQAAEMAREALEGLEESRMEWLEEWMEQIREALRGSAEDALALARRQDEVRVRVPGANEVLRRGLQSEEAAILEGIRNLATRLALATREAPQIGREVLGALVEAQEAGVAVTEDLERASGSSGQAAQASLHAIRHLNRAALLALQGLDQVGERGGGGESQAFQDLMDELESLAGEQSAANEAASQAASDATADGADAQRQQAAGAQEEVARRLEELARGAAGDATSSQIEEMAAEARELARELDEGRLDAEVLERQQELLERLLSAGRTLEREGPTEEREGTAAGEVERRAITPLPRTLLEGSFLAPPGPEALGRLTPAERRLVLEYFERLNRRGAGAADPGGVR